MKIKFIFALTCLLPSYLSLPAFSQSTTFTYQGSLIDNGNPALGSYDLSFALYDDASAGDLQGEAVTNNAVAVSNGLFTVTLDFGAGVFDGNERWLEIGVVTNGGGSFSTLIPRQPIATTPYAIQAAKA